MRQPFSATPFRLSFLFVLSLVAMDAAQATDAWWQVAQRLQPAGAIDFTPHGTQPGLSNDLQVSDQCASCHSANADDERAFRPYSSWSGSMMANATRECTISLHTYGDPGTKARVFDPATGRVEIVELEFHNQ